MGSDWQTMTGLLAGSRPNASVDGCGEESRKV
jgi:hypothetical protein